MMCRSLGLAFMLAALMPTLIACGQVKQPVAEPRRAYDPQGSYAVVVSAETLADEDWAKVVAVLREKYDAALIVYPRGQLGGIAAKLAEIFPRYACFVATPEEASRTFVVQVHRLTRHLDEDPYTDLVWGILTGYNAADALKIADRREPLIIKRASSSMGPGVFQDLSGGFASEETKKSQFSHKKDGGATIHEEVSPDAVKSLVEYFNQQPPDLFVTSGHATERDWQVYYNIRGGQFLCDYGQLYGLDSDNKRYDINSPNPKVYLPAGNCLIGHITGSNCMVTAWIHSGGVFQMCGYSAVTFFGYMGWGVSDIFGHPWDLADACYFTNQGLIYELNKKFPDSAGIEFNTYDHNAISTIAAKHSITNRDLLGYLWDRDILAFYGDPAWIAHKPAPQTWRYDITRSAESVTVVVEALADGKWPAKPLIVPFAQRLKDFRSPSCDASGIEPTLTDNFLLLPLKGRDSKVGERITVKFGARPIESHPTSSKSPATVIARNAVTAATMPMDDALGPQSLSGLVPPDMAFEMTCALQQAGENHGKLYAAIHEATAGPERDDVLFLIVNMPLRDLRTLPVDYLLKNVRFARQARATSPWGSKFSDEVYRNFVLPYASITEAREDWRGDFFKKLMPVVKDCKSAGEAAVNLNQTIFNLFNVRYDAQKRPRPDQGPLESIKASYASCSGLSVLLVDACRAVGVPARIAGVAQWNAKRNSGNHTWVEVMDDDGNWYALGASESKALNDVWFAKAASEVDSKQPFNHIYATTFTRGPLRFPCAWDPYADYISAIDRTEDYRNLAKPVPAHSGR